MTRETPTTRKLNRLARKLCVSGLVVRSDQDAAGRYLLFQKSLPLIGLGWTYQEAAQALHERKELYGGEA